MTSWLQQYKAQLDSIAASGTSFRTSKDIADAILSIDPVEAHPFNWSELAKGQKAGAGRSYGDVLKESGGHFISGGQRILDVLSRANYASANVQKYNLEHPTEDLFSFDTIKRDLGALAAAGRGLAGTEKTTYSDVLKTGGVTNPWVKGVGGFVGDVALDPTTYLGIGAIKSLGGLPFKAAGKEVPKFGRAKNALTTAKVTMPVEKAAMDLATEGATRVPTAKADTLVKYLNDRIVEPHPDYLNPGAVDPRATQLPFDVVPDKAINKWRPANAAQWAEMAKVKQIADQLTDIPARRYGKGVKVSPIYSEAVQQVPTTVMKPVTRDIVGKTVDEVLTDIGSRVPAKGIPLIGRSGARFARDLKTGASISVRKQVVLTANDLVGFVKTGKIPKHLSEAYIKTPKGLQSLDTIVKDLKNEVTDAELGINKITITEQVPHTTYEEIKTFTRLSPKERVIWLAEHKDILDPEDVSKIIRTNSPARAAKAIEEVLAQKGPQTFSSAADLIKAVEEGLVDPADIQSIVEKLGFKGYKQMAQREREALLRLEKASAAARAVGDTKAPFQAGLDEQGRFIIDAPIDAPIPSNAALTAAKTVKPAKQLVDEVLAQGNVTGFAQPKTALSETQTKAVLRAIKVTTQREFIDPRNKAIYGAVSKTGTKRTSVIPGEGLGRNLKGFNKYSQLTLSSAIRNEAKKIVDVVDPVTGLMLKGTERASKMYETAMPMYKAAEDFLRAQGITPILGKGKTGLPLSMHDILFSLHRDVAQGLFFDFNKAMTETQLADIAADTIRLARGQIDEVTFKSILSDRILKPTGKLVSNFSKFIQAFKKVSTQERYINTTADFFIEAAPKMLQALERNSAENAIKLGEETQQLTTAAIDTFTKIVMNPASSAADILHAITDPKSLVVDASKIIEEAADTVPISEASKLLAATQTTARIGTMVSSPTALAAAKAARETLKATTQLELARISAKLGDSTLDEARYMIQDMNVSALDIGADAEFGFGVGMFRAFNPHLGNESLRPILTERRSVAQTMSLKFASQLGKIGQTHASTDIVEAFRLIQDGKVITEGPVGAALADLQPAISYLFDSDAALGILTRNQITAAHLKSKFAKFKIPNMYKLDGTNADTLANSWKTWDVKDPLDLLSKMNAAIQSATAEREVGALFSSKFGKHFPTAAAAKAAGYIKIVDPKGKSPIYPFLDSERWFHEDIARQMPMLDWTLKELAIPASNNKALKVLDSALHSYKAGLTIYRPGHHVRNLVGDVWLSAMDGVVNPIYYIRSAVILATRHGQYKDIDALRVLQTANPNGKATKSVLTLTHRGKKISLSDAETYRRIFDSGILTDYSVLEDVNFGAAAGEFKPDSATALLSNISPLRLIGQQGKIKKTMSGLSEYRDHFVRTAHALKVLGETSLNSKLDLEDALKEAFSTAGQRVRKWHPDGSDLSRFESQFMRRSILFYSWIRKAIPLVVETAVTRPGRLMVYPKAMYNVAEANGIDLNGFGNPFPLDQLFPEYIADSTQGPQFGESGSYLGIKPGIPSMDVLDDYASSSMTTGRTLASSVNPLVKIPFETVTDTSTRTGTPIQDTSDYIDQQIPLGSQIGKAAGAVGSLFGGSGESRSFSTGFTQPTRVSPSNVGYEGNVAPNRDLINLLLGLGIVDYSKPSSLKAAEFDLKRRAQEERKAQGG